MRLVYLGQTLGMKNAVLLKNFGLALWAGVLFVKQLDTEDYSYLSQVIPEDIEKNLLQEIPQPRAVPKRLDEYTPEEIAAFPKVWTP